MVLLSIETSSFVGSIAIHKKKSDGTNELLSCVEWQRQKSHSEWVTKAIADALKQSKMELPELSAIAVSLGPGSFTGLRVGVNAARALAYSLDVPVVAFNSLQVLAEPALNFGLPVAVMTNAFKNMIYFARASRSAEVVPTVLSAAALELQETHLCVGDGFGAYKDFFKADTLKFLSRDPRAQDVPTASALGQMALSQWSSVPKLDWHKVTPLYLRASEAEEKLKAGLLKPIKNIFE